MIKKIVIKCFRKLEDNTFDFTQGLNVIRASNEAGKSTLMEAAFYALYGSKALRNSIDDTVTWGQPVKSLKVELTIEAQGGTYAITRSKAGAEVTQDGHVLVTGQSEVTSFIETLIGCNLGTSQKLMLASQGNLRGALEDGPKATSEMVEDLADFDVFETILELMQQKLALGSDAALKEQLKMYREELESIENNGAEDPSEQIKNVTEQGKALAKKHNALQVEFRAANDTRNAFMKIQGQRQEKDRLLVQSRILSKEYNELADEIEELEKHCTVKHTDKVEKKREEIHALGQITALRKVFDQMNELNTLSKDVTSFDINALTLQRDTLKSEVNEVTTKNAETNTQIKLLQAQIITDLNCPTCKRPVEDHESIQKSNLETLQKIDGMRKEMASYADQITDAKESLTLVEKDLYTVTKLHQFSTRESEYVRFENGLVWEGPDVNVDVDAKIQALKHEIKELEDDDKVALANTAKAQALTRQGLDMDKRITQLKQQADEIEAPEITFEMDVEFTKSCTVFFESEGKIKEVNSEIALNESERSRIQLLVNNFMVQVQRKKTLEELISRIDKDIGNVAFNNNLLKKIRAARPLVANQLWNMVLASVSTMFSRMRGVDSIVSKDKEGFKVNGETVTSLSGSAKDLLGLAVRCALIKMFVPNAPFLILDEPTAASDEHRTLKMLGFIQSTDFAQKILITHEDVSESLADNLITF